MEFQTDKQLIDSYLLRLTNIIGEPVHLDNSCGNTTVRAFSEVQDYEVLTKKGRIVSSFSLVQLPGCCAFVVSYHVSVQHEYRGKGIGSLMNQFRMDIARRLNYTAMICTDNLNNTDQRAILAKNGLQDIYDCINKKTGNPIAISLVTL